jgi:oligosaccharide repeat unit polymerase
MLWMIWAVLTAATLLPLVIGAVIGLRAARPALLMTCLTLVVYVVYAPVRLQLGADPFSLDILAAVKAQALSLMYATLLLVSAAVFHRRSLARQAALDYGMDATEGAIAGGGGGGARPAALLLAAAVLTALAIVAGAMFGMLGGLEGWSRRQQEVVTGTGILSTLALNQLLFALVVFYLAQSRTLASLPLVLFACLNLLLAAYSFLFSGVTNGPVLLLIPFGVLWFMRLGRPSALRLATVMVTGFAAVWVLRLMRMIGAVSEAGRLKVSLSDALRDFGGSGLHPADSFPEFFFFSKTIQFIDAGGPMLAGKSYLYSLLQFIPGALWPGKAQFALDSRVDEYVNDIVLNRDDLTGTIPVGIYGEGYANFGTVGVLLTAVLIGWFAARVDSRYRTTLWGLPGPLACAMFAPIFVSNCRNASSHILVNALPILLFALACWAVQPLLRHGRQPGADDLASPPPLGAPFPR